MSKLCLHSLLFWKSKKTFSKSSLEARRQKNKGLFWERLSKYPSRRLWKLGHNKHVCKQCDYRAFTRRTIKTHIKNKHEGYLFSCNQCDFKNARNDAVNEHIARIHDGVVYRCERCDLVMTSKGSLKSHNSLTTVTNSFNVKSANINVLAMQY